MRLKSIQTVKCKMKKKKKKRKRKKRRRIRDLTTKVKICIYLASWFISIIATEVSSSAIFQRNTSEAVWSWTKEVEIVDINASILEYISFIQRLISTTTNSTWPKLTLDWNVSYHPSADNPNPVTVNFIWRFFNFSLYFKKESIIALLLTSTLSTLK